MLQTLTVKNFQAHKRLEVDFDPRVTSIIGPSDVGKSSVIRALKWLLRNTPSGTAFIREGSKSTSVHLILGSGEEIHRERSASKNLYKLGAMEFKAFGNDVPPEVQHTGNVSDINFQGQHDSPFWFCETSGEVSRQLNRIVDLSIIDTTLSNLDKANREAKSRVTLTRERLINAKLLRSKHVPAKKMDSQLTQLEKMKEELSRVQDQRLELEELVDGIKDQERTFTKAEGALKAANLVIGCGETWLAHQKHRQSLEARILEIKILEDGMQVKIPNVDHLIELEKKYKVAATEREALEDAVFAIESAESTVQKLTEQAETAKSNFEQEMGDVCPLCGKPTQ